ncbi:hypothetical protein B0H13DRAFT_2032257, partial [Mycena leptocephala]
MGTCLVIWALSGIFWCCWMAWKMYVQTLHLRFRRRFCRSRSRASWLSRIVFLIANFFCSIFEPLLRFFAISSGDRRHLVLLN